MSNAKINKPLSTEHRKKISGSLAGKPKAPFSEQHRENIGKVHRGKPWSEARRAAQDKKGNQNS
jgi:hypothetical protein